MSLLTPRLSILILGLLYLGQSCTDLCTDEVSSLQSELKTLTRARELLQQGGSADQFTLLPYTDPSWILPKFIEKSVIKGSDAIKASVFITLKPMPELLHSSNIGFIVAYSSGLVELRQITGQVLYKMDLGYQIHCLAATNSYDEIRFAAITSKSTLEIYSILIEKPLRTITVESQGVQTTKLFISISKEAESEISGKGLSLLFHIRGGKKFWVLGGDSGLVIYNFAGQKETIAELGVGPILSLDRIGPQLVVASTSAVGILNYNTMDLQPRCTSGGSYISLDTSNFTSVVYVVTGDGVAIMDTRSVSGENFVCKGKE